MRDEVGGNDRELAFCLESDPSDVTDRADHGRYHAK
jgi:hypothetical protein